MIALIFTIAIIAALYQERGELRRLWRELGGEQ